MSGEPTGDNPYAAPAASLLSAEGPAVQPAPSGERVDLGAAVRWLTAHPEWASRNLLAGLLLFVPILGWIAVMGWSRRAFHEVREGRSYGVPELRFAEDLREGWAPFAAWCVTTLLIWMLLALVLGGFSLLLAALAWGLNEGGQSGLSGVVVGLLLGPLQLAQALVGVVFYLIIPEQVRRSYHGEIAVILRPGPSVAAVRPRPAAYAITVAFTALAYIFCSLGLLVFCVGYIFTFPAGMVLVAHLTAQWAAVVDPPASG